MPSTYVKGETVFAFGGQLGQDRDEPLNEGKLLLAPIIHAGH